MWLTSPLYSLKAWKSMSSDAVSKLYKVEGSCVFHRLHGKTRLMKYYTPSNPRTASQQAWRASFASAVNSWQELSEDEKASWKHYQINRRKRPVMDGYNLYISKWLLSGGNPVIPQQG